MLSQIECHYECNVSNVAAMYTVAMDAFSSDEWQDS
jgi:hypothetical protein